MTAAITIYVDEMRSYPSGRWCHMWAAGGDSEQENDAALDTFAALIGLEKEWAHLSGGISGRFYHYDLRESKRRAALNAKAVALPLKDWIKMQTKGSTE